MTLNKPNPRLAILRAQLAADADAIKLQRLRYKMSSAIGCSCPVPAPDADSLPLPPSYSEDLEQWLAQREIERVHEAVLERQSAARSVAPAKPAAPRPDPATAGMNKRHASIYAEHVAEQQGDAWRSGPTIPEIERVGLWHYKTVSDGTVGVAEQGSSFSFDCPGEYRPAAPGTKYGDPYDESKYVTADLTARIASTSSADGAALVGVKLMHSVCIKAHGFADWQIGEICPGGPGEFAHPENWLPCDEDGWVPHTPTSGSVCPVPDGILCAVKQDNGSVCGDTKFNPPRTGNDWFGWDSIIIAWRPIADGGK